MKVLEIFAIDFEGNAQKGVVEFGVVTLRGDLIEDPISDFCHIDRTNSIFFSRLLPLEKTEEKVPFFSHFHLFQSLRMRGILAAHHSPVEESFLRRLWPTAGPAIDWLKRESTTLCWGPWIDTLSLCRRHFPHWESFVLQTSVEHMGLEREVSALADGMCPPSRRRHHCALFDSIACAVVLRKLLQSIPLSVEEALRQSLPAARRDRLRQSTLLL
ncbi:MAG: hypothetical protein LBI69_01535 [Puniceicoccales bacterium]|jgi:DNA polymerase-3 subunit epsilon|nr:hypothetical protein [Puniceicoccales bacterium]